VWASKRYVKTVILHNPSEFIAKSFLGCFGEQGFEEGPLSTDLLSPKVLNLLLSSSTLDFRRFTTFHRYSGQQPAQHIASKR
jgi:hypothetical protein